MSSVHKKIKTDFLQTVNLSTVEWQLRVKGSNIYQYKCHHLLKKPLKNLIFSSKPSLKSSCKS